MPASSKRVHCCIHVSRDFLFFFFKQKTAYEIMPSLVGSEMCIRDRYTAVYTLASDGHVGRSRVRNPAPLYFFSCFMFSFLCFPFFFIYTPMEVVSPVGMFVYTAVYTLAADAAAFFYTSEQKN